MSQFRKAEIAKQFTDWLDRYSQPMNLRDKPQAAQAEVESLINVLIKMAPQADYQPFIGAVTEKLDFTMKVRTWPSVQELGAACSNVRKENPQRISSAMPEVDLSPEGITARRMMNGEPVGEGWLYGRMACDLIAKGAVTREVMDRYRSAAFLSRKALYGHDAALAWEAEAKERHEAAKEIYRQRREEPTCRGVRVPDMSMPFAAE